MSRSRLLTPDKQAQLCRLVAQGATIEQAADAVDVTLRTVQREIARDEDFEHDLRLAEQEAPVDPLKLMQRHARAHWRAAAWLLERTDPERFGKRRPNSCTPRQFSDALVQILNAALAAVPAEQRPALAAQFQAAAAQAADSLFPASNSATPSQSAPAPELAPTTAVLRPTRQVDLSPKTQIRHSAPQSPSAQHDNLLTERHFEESLKRAFHSDRTKRPNARQHSVAKNAPNAKPTQPAVSAEPLSPAASSS